MAKSGQAVGIMNPNESSLYLHYTGLMKSDQICDLVLDQFCITGLNSQIQINETLPDHAASPPAELLSEAGSSPSPSRPPAGCWDSTPRGDIRFAETI